MAQADVATPERGDRLISEIFLAAQAVTAFMPVMVLSTRQGLMARPIHGQVGSDHDKYLTITSAVVDAL
jgi:hypothetical protein